MENFFKIEKIAHIRCGFSSKFGIPRQSGLCSSLSAQIIFEQKFRNPDAFRDLDGFSHIWLIWQFSETVREKWSPTVRPPRLGGNKRTGVFATRSPFRPNPLGLSCVKLEKIEFTKNLGPILHISGADLLDGTPIYDIKPYIPYADCKPDASGGFTENVEKATLKVEISSDIISHFDDDILQCIKEIIEQDPRPAYQDDTDRIYKMNYDNRLITFAVKNQTATVLSICEEKE